MRGRKRIGFQKKERKINPLVEILPRADDTKSAEITPTDTLSLSSSISSESIQIEHKAPKRRSSSRKQVQVTYNPREDTKKIIQNSLEKCLAWASVAEETRESVVRRVERACYNCVIDQCSELYIEKSWDQMEFVNRYSSTVYKLVSNINLSREYFSANNPTEAASFGDKIIRGEINPVHSPLMSSYEMFPEATQKERDILDFRSEQKVQKKFTTRYRCAQCGQHKAEPKEVQTAANDEISTFNLLCLVCGHTWFQK